MADAKINKEEAFKDSLLDVIVIMEKLSPYCKDVKDMIAMLQHGTENEGQARLLLSIVEKR